MSELDLFLYDRKGTQDTRSKIIRKCGQQNSLGKTNTNSAHEREKQILGKSDVKQLSRNNRRKDDFQQTENLEERQTLFDKESEKE